MKILGVVLVILGALMLGYKAITYSRHETVTHVGPIQVQQEKKKTVPLSPVVGGTVLAGGLILLVIGDKRSR